MAEIPSTSTTLLRDVAGDSQHARWGEFVACYRPMMEAFLREHFPFAEADEIIQETLVALVDVLPNYEYNPDETGHFRNYLTGIVRHKAMRQQKKAERRQDIVSKYREATAYPAKPDEDEAWRTSLFEVALHQLLADKSVQGRTKQVFVRVAVNGESPDDVAVAFGIARNAVDQIKSRMTAKLRTLVAALEKADGVGR